MKILRGVSGNILTSFSGGIRKLLYVVQLGGYGRLYNWFCTQPQITGIKYGYLYNWLAATDSRNIANIGFHLSTYQEFDTLSIYLGGSSGAGIKMMESGSLHWDTPYFSGTNTSKFNAYGTGLRSASGEYVNIRQSTEFITLDFTYAVANFFFNCAKNSLSDLGSGRSVRLVKDSITLTNGQTGTYTGNDGRIYKTICIGTQEWLSENLAETKYRNGDLIAKVTDNTAWAALTTGAMCAYNNDEANAFETASIAPVGFHVPSDAEWTTLLDNIDIYDSFVQYWPNAGGYLKEVGLNHWIDPNTGAVDSYGFKAIGSGSRDSAGSFIDSDSGNDTIKDRLYIWSMTGADNYGGVLNMFSFDSLAAISVMPVNCGNSIRLIKDDSTWTAGDTVTDVDGNVYPLIKIGDIVITAKNWKCTKFADGTPIPLVEDNTEWSLLETPGQCIYENILLNL